MTQTLDLTDIQGNIVRAYGRFGFPHARYFFLHISNPKAGRDFLRQIEPKVTTAERWQGGPDDPTQTGIPRPQVTLNIGLSYQGLVALDLPSGTLMGLPEAFVDGMVKRAPILGDHGPSDLSEWDEVWRNGAARASDAIHLMISMSAQMTADGSAVPELEEQTKWLCELAQNSGGVRILPGNGPSRAIYQQAGAQLVRDERNRVHISPKEHFGFVDGIGDPVFEGQFTPAAEERRVKGRGKLTKEGDWLPLATGEFVLGHVDESQELPDTTFPSGFTQNGSFMAFRKLHEDVDAFQTFIAEQSKVFARQRGMSVEEASETLRAKMVGRWSNGVPLLAAPTFADLMQFEKDWADIPAIRRKGRHRTTAESERLQAYKNILIDFRYRDDKIGLKCPIASHIRRGHVRDYLDPKFYAGSDGEYGGTAISNRRRILRRGLPYGRFDTSRPKADQEHGVLFLAICTSLERQFEFVLQQWINYGMDSNSGNDTCPLLGPRAEHSKFVIQASQNSGDAPFIMADIPQFVSTRGGEYFFLPGLSSLRMMANGIVDPI